MATATGTLPPLRLERPTGGAWLAEVSYGADASGTASRQVSADHVQVGSAYSGVPVRPGTTEPDGP